MAARTEHEGSAFLVEAMAERLFDPLTRQQQPQLIDAVREVMSRADPRAVAAALRGMAARSDMTARLTEIQTPTLVVCGESDVISPASEMRTMAEALGQSTFVSIPCAGHLSPLEQPATVNRAILEFLGS